MEAYLTAISYYLPQTVIDNTILNQQHPTWSADKISEKTGILQRHIAGEDEFSSDMAMEAANKLFNSYEIDRKSIDFILLCTQSPDYFLPTTACTLQHRLGLSKNCGALDFNLGCSGFVYGLGLAKGLIASGQAKNVLLITSETYSKFIHNEDKSNKTIFGDAAAAALVSDQKGELSGRIMQFEYGTDGSGAEALIVKHGGMKHRHEKGTDELKDATYYRNNDYLFMDGKAVFEFTMREVPPLLEKSLSKNGLSMSDINLYVFHQANKFMLNAIRRKCEIPIEKFFINIESCGNTVSSTIPIALIEALKSKQITPDNKVLIAGFGVGLSWGCTVIEY